MKKKFKLELTTTQKIMLSFLVVILAGSVLLALPISSASGEAVPYLDALFMATTSTCVTGLVTLPTVTTWSFFGQVVILLLIQIGGLGVITIVTGLAVGIQHRMGIGDSIIYIYQGHKEWEGTKEQVFSATNQRLNDFIFASDLLKKIKKEQQF